MSPEADAVGPLSVVIPAYNESARIGATLRTLVTYLQGWPAPAEIIVVDDGSTDDTAALARRILAGTELPHRVLSGRANRGKGYTVREGALAARHARYPARRRRAVRTSRHHARCRSAEPADRAAR